MKSNVVEFPTIDTQVKSQLARVVQRQLFQNGASPDAVEFVMRQIRQDLHAADFGLVKISSNTEETIQYVQKYCSELVGVFMLQLTLAHIREWHLLHNSN